jgi:nitrite reductase (NADH) small subunit
MADKNSKARVARARKVLILNWSHPPGSNRRPADYESAALPTELGWLAEIFPILTHTSHQIMDRYCRAMPLVSVGRIGALPPGAVKEVDTGSDTYAVCNGEGTLHCVDGPCPHAGGPLGQGNLNGNLLVCPWHCWEFDCGTGVNDFDEDLRIEKFPVVVQGNEILIDVP